MSLINTLENLEVEFGDVWISKELGSRIVAALKAGQDMYDDIKLTGNYTQSMVAWDEATKEDE
jgi:hypothetical protein